MTQTIFPLAAVLLCFLHSILFGDALDPNFGSLAGAVRSHRRLQSADELCHQAMLQTLGDPNQAAYEWECACKEVKNSLDGSSGAFHLTCTSTCGQFCNRKNDVCLIPGFIQGFDANGENYLFSQTYQYIQGRMEYVDRSVYFNLEGAPLACQYGIDETLCQSCEITPCISGGAPIDLHCENLREGTTFDFCSDPTPAVEDGVFEFLNPEDFTVCTPLTPPTPTQVETTPTTQVETSPTQVETTPTQMATSPTQVQTTPTQMESTPPPVPSPTIRPMMGKVLPQEGGDRDRDTAVSGKGGASYQSPMLLIVHLSLISLLPFLS